MNKTELIAETANKVGIPASHARKAVDTITNSIGEALAKKDKVSLAGFGTFLTRDRAPRRVRNIHNGEMIAVPASRVPYFRPSKVLKGLINREVKDSQPANAISSNNIEKAGSTTGKVTAKDTVNPNPKVIAVTSGKGGTGKTNFVINTAIILARKGLRVYIIDADLGTANVDVLLGLHCKKTINNLVDNRSVRLKDIIVEGPEGIQLIPGGSGLQTLAQLPTEELGRIIGMFKKLEEEADLIIIDTGSGISRNVVDFAIAADEVIIIITPEPHSISDAYAIMKVLNSKENCPPIKMVFNQVESVKEAYLASSRLQETSERFLDLKPEMIGHIFKDETVVKSVKLFKPVVQFNPVTPASLCFTAIADKMVAFPKDKATIVEEKKSFFNKLKSIFSKTTA